MRNSKRTSSFLRIIWWWNNGHRPWKRWWSFPSSCDHVCVFTFVLVLSGFFEYDSRIIYYEGITTLSRLTWCNDQWYGNCYHEKDGKNCETRCILMMASHGHLITTSRGKNENVSRTEEKTWTGMKFEELNSLMTSKQILDWRMYLIVESGCTFIFVQNIL